MEYLHDCPRVPEHAGVPLSPDSSAESVRIPSKASGGFIEGEVQARRVISDPGLDRRVMGIEPEAVPRKASECSGRGHRGIEGDSIQQHWTSVCRPSASR
jgi:hypothetical protein